MKAKIIRMKPTLVDKCEMCPFYHTLDQSCYFFMAVGLGSRPIENSSAIPEFCPLEDAEIDVEDEGK